MSYSSGVRTRRISQRKPNVGYIRAVLEQSMGIKVFCPAVGVTIGQTVDMVVKFLKAKPEIRHQTATYLIYQATEEFRCHN